MLWLGEMLQKYPELAVFAALGIGYWIGSLRIAGFSFGGVTGSLLAGILVGWLFVVPVSAPAKSLVFLLFLFGVGYEVGPRFFTALKGDGWRFSVLGVFVPVIGLLAAWAVASYLQLDPGFSAGMMSGGLTQSPAMGTASEAITALNIDADLKAKYIANVGIADALCYVFGALGVIIFCTELAPRLLKLDLPKEALALEAKFGMQRSADGYKSAWQPHETRAYRFRRAGPWSASHRRRSGSCCPRPACTCIASGAAAHCSRPARIFGCRRATWLQLPDAGNCLSNCWASTPRKWTTASCFPSRW